MPTPRRERRKGFTDGQRIGLLEDDMDLHEQMMTRIGRDIEQKLEGFDGKFDKVQAVLIGILVSVTTASILMALNLVVNAG